MKRNSIFYSLLFLGTCWLLISSCGKNGKADSKPVTPEEMIAKSWKLDKLDMSSDAMDPAIMGTSSFTFYKNGRYEILMGELERGKWWLSTNKKVLFTQADDRPNAGEMDIVKLETNLLILTNNLASKPVTFELVPVP